ncbi:Sterol 24-C-methyltransferase [Handroanthus impetiginosus]|uniref:Sterol 24-C-methyltransferase n=1 Tax=Handroanthus impetiginosus TaxID=429701 RepID=A0A2G9HL95_9LAMI|nr:Sterol 24-C-methyltransferase [Handroanthus impetiginosus]
MKTDLPKLPLLLKPFFLSLFLFLSFLAFFSLQAPFTKTTTETTPEQLPSDLEIRPGYSSYEAYLQRQLNKTLNPKLRQIWTTRDWDRKVRVFSEFFENLKQRELLSNGSKSLCIGARVGQEVAALKRGDFHHQPFDDETFDFEFSNVFDHALYPRKFVGEIERTLKHGGICVLHVLLSRRADKYSANDLYSVKPLIKLFKNSEVVEVRRVDGFGLDTEVVFRKKL